MARHVLAQTAHTERMNALPDLLTRLRRFLTRHSVTVATVAAFVTALALIGAWRPSPSTAVVSVNQPLTAGQIIHSDDLETIAFTGKVPDDALRDASVAVGQRLRVKVLPGVPLRAAYFSNLSQTEPGRQTMLLEVEPALAAVLAPGDRVDVYQNCGAAPLTQDSATPCAATVLAQGVEVMQVQKDGGSQWTSPHSTNLTIKAGAEQIKVLAGVSDTRSLTIARVEDNE